MKLKQQTTVEQARIAKDLLYKGKSQDRVSAIVGISQASVSRLRAGKLHPEVPWPDGSTGALSFGGGPTIMEDEWSADAKRMVAYPDIVQTKIHAVVNERRILLDLPEIPTIDPMYARYLNDPEEGTEEGLTLEDARRSEDERLATIIREFDSIVHETMSHRRDAEIYETLTATRTPPVDSWSSQQDVAVGVSSLNMLPAPCEPFTYEALDWSYIVKHAPRNTLVTDALANDDPLLYEATCIAFAATNEWKGEAAERLVSHAYTALKAHVEIHDELTLKHKHNM